jgi:hypothetical protein
MTEHEFYKKIERYEVISEQVKKKVQQDLNSTQCKKASFYEQHKGYVKYIQTVLSKWSIFHHASASVDSLWKRLMRDVFDLNRQTD